MPARRRALLLALVLAASLSLDLVGIDWGLPYLWNSDEKIDQAATMVHYRTLNPEYFVNPTLHIYAVTAAVAAARAWHPEQGVQLSFRRIAPMTDPRHPARPMQFLAMRLARGVSVAAAVLTVWLVFALGRRQFDEPTALLAAAFVAVTMGLVTMAHYATVESLLILLVVSALGAIERVAVTGGRWSYVGAGALAGLAVSTKYTAVLLAVPFLAAHVRQWGWRRAAGRDALGRLVPGLAAIPAAFLTGTPYAVLSWSRFGQEAIVFNWLTGAPGGSLMAGGRSYEAYAVHLVNALGWPLFLLCLAGLAAAAGGVRRKGAAGNRAALVHLIWVLAFYGVYGLSPHNALRFILPVVPSLVLLAAHWSVTVRRELRPGAPRLTWTAGVALVLAYSLAYSARCDWMFLHDPRYEAGAWLARQAAVRERGVSHFLIECYLPFFDRPSYPIRFLPFVDNLRVRGADFTRQSDAHLATHSELIVDADLYYLRFLDAYSFFGTRQQLQERRLFYRALLLGTHRSGYRVVRRFEIRNPRWLDPRPEKVAPVVVIFGKP